MTKPANEYDGFDIACRHVLHDMIEVCKLADTMQEGPFRSGMILAIEELYFRLTNENHHLDWEALKMKLPERKETNALQSKTSKRGSA